jgi:hypothetical protein
MGLLRVTKCTVFGDDGTDGWGLAPACWGLSGKEFRIDKEKEKRDENEYVPSPRAQLLSVTVH